MNIRDFIDNYGDIKVKYFHYELGSYWFKNSTNTIKVATGFLPLPTFFKSYGKRLMEIKTISIKKLNLITPLKHFIIEA